MPPVGPRSESHHRVSHPVAIHRLQCRMIPVGWIHRPIHISKMVLSTVKSGPPGLAESPRGSARPASWSHRRSRRANTVRRRRDSLRPWHFSWGGGFAIMPAGGSEARRSTANCQSRRGTFVPIAPPRSAGGVGSIGGLLSVTWKQTGHSGGPRSTRCSTNWRCTRPGCRTRACYSSG